MAQTSSVSYSHLRRAHRLDAEFFKPEHLHIENLLSERNTKTLRQLKASVVSGPFGSTLKSSAYRRAGIPFVRISNLSSFFIDKDSIVYIDESDHERIKSSELIVGDLVLSKVGNTIGIVSKVTTDIGVCNISENNIGIKLRYLDEETKNYALVFLNCRYGQKQVLRYISGNAQPKLNVSDIANVQIVLATAEFRKIIGNKVDTAQRLYYESANHYSHAEQLLLSELGLQNWKPTHTLAYVRNYSQATRARRMDAEHFQPKFDEVAKHIFAYQPQRLSKLATQIIETVKFDERQKYRYIEISDVNTSNGEIGYTEREVKDLPPNAKIKVKGGELIVSKVRPTRGAIGVVPDDCWDNGVCSSAFVVLDVPSPVREFLQVYLRSIVGRALLEQPCKGTSYPTIDDTDVKALPIPTISTQTQEKISELVSQSRLARREAKTILEKAKRAVEIAIEEGEDKAMEFIG